jgi:hypothetical protein
MKKPLVFISYVGAEVALADFVKKHLGKISNDGVEIFVARRDISSGEDPLKIMLNEKLKNADAIIPICSKNSKETPWLWWETASVWAKTGMVYPLFTNISANSFGGPLVLVAQGKDYFIKEEFLETLHTICKKLSIVSTKFNFDDEDEKQFLELKENFSKNNLSAKVSISFNKLIINQDYHKYSLNFEVQNNSSTSYTDLTLQLFFPEKYLIQKEWNYDHLRSSTFKENPKYICLTFDFNSMPESGKKRFSTHILVVSSLLCKCSFRCYSQRSPWLLITLQSFQASTP